MAPWAIALILVAVVCVGAWLVDRAARRKRRGLTNLAGPSVRRPGRVAEVEGTQSGITQQATGNGATNAGPLL